MKTKHKNFAKRVVALCLAFCLTVQTFVSAAPSESVPAETIGYEDVTNATGFIGGLINLSDDLASLGSNASAETVACTIFDSIFGTNISGKKTTDDWLEDIYDQVDELNDKVDHIGATVGFLAENAKEVNKKLDAVNNKLDTVNSKLDSQAQTLTQMTQTLKEMKNGQESISRQISNLKDSLSDQITDSSNKTLIAIYHSTAEVNSANALLENIQTYYKSFDGLESVEKTIMDDLKQKQTDYENFMIAVDSSEQGSDIKNALNKLTMDFDDSYAALSNEEKALLDTKLTIKDYGTITVKKFMSDYMDSMHTYMTVDIGKKNSGYTSNLYDTVNLMGEYILGKVTATGNTGVGENFYKLSMINCSTNDEVHTAYKDFMEGVMLEYYTTAYLYMLSMSYEIAYESANGGNSSTIRTNRNHIANIENQMKEIDAYLDYEYANCMLKYDFNGYINSDYDQYLCYYGNQKNAKDGIKNWLCRHKKNVYVKGGLSATDLKLAMGEEKGLHLYYGTKDVTAGATWTSSNENVVQVNTDGTVVAVSTGDAVITAEYDGKPYKCMVGVKSMLALKNGTSTSNYHYTVNKEDKTFSCHAEVGYDYYYNVKSYLAVKAKLSDTTRALSICTLTDLSERELEQFNWLVASEGVADVVKGQLCAVDSGKTAIFGCRYWEDENLYEYIGIPVENTFDVSATLEKDKEPASQAVTDYSGYTKISTKADLIALANNPDGWGMDSKYVLTDDIDLEEMEWNPIGYAFSIDGEDIEEDISVKKDGKGNYHKSASSFKPFCGIFDGNGHTISNFRITKLPHQAEMAKALTEVETKAAQLSEEAQSKGETAKFIGNNELRVTTLGLFGAVQLGNITNLNVINADINLDNSLDGKSSITVKDGNTEHTINLSLEKGIDIYAGAMVGRSSADALIIVDSMIENCLNEDGTISENSLNASLELDEETKTAFMDFLEKGSAQLETDLEGKTDEEKTAERRDQYRSTLMLPFFCQISKMRSNVYGMNECYAEGSLNINIAGNKGSNYVGVLAGTSSGSLDNCEARGEIQTTGNGGSIGSLVGRWDVVGSTKLNDSQANVQIKSIGGDTVGGLVGSVNMDLCFGTKLFELSPKDFIIYKQLKNDGTYSQSMLFADKTTFFVLLIAFSDWIGGIQIRDIQKNSDMNINVSKCQFRGSLSGEGNIGGLIGEKCGNHQIVDASIDATFKEDPADGTYEIDTTGGDSFSCSYNMDIDECYVVSDIHTSGDYAGGILGYSNVDKDDKRGKPYDEENPDTTEYLDGSIQNCYYYGDVSAQKAAAGIAAGGTLDYAKMHHCMAVSKHINAGDGISEEDPTATPTALDTNCFKIDEDTLYYYRDTEYEIKKKDNPTEYKVENILGKEKTASELDKDDAYQALWPDNLFLEVSDKLDVKNGVIPSYLGIRYHFPIETARKYYRVGDTFEPITEVRKNNGIGMVSITEGVTSTAPDMTKPGIRQVRVCYGDYSATYPVIIYPIEDCCMKVTDLPIIETKKDGSTTLKGGKIAVYNSNGEKTSEKSIDDCTTEVSEDGTYYTIQYGKFTTAVKVVNIYVYSNGLTQNGKPVLQKTHKCVEGSLVDANVIVDSEMKSGEDGIVYELQGMSLSEDEIFTAENDVYILTLYTKKSGTDNPSGDTPSGDKPSGDTPSGDKPSGDTPSSQQPVTSTGENQDPEEPKVGDITADDKGKASYTISNVEKKEVSYTASKDNNVKAITIPTAVTIGGQRYKVTKIEDKAFNGCKKLSSVKISNNITVIGDSAFSGCTKLTKITIPKNVTSIGKNTFKGCKNLKKITIKSKKIKKFGKNVFKGISKKATISVPKSKKKAYTKLLKKAGFTGKIK